VHAQVHGDCGGGGVRGGVIDGLLDCTHSSSLPLVEQAIRSVLCAEFRSPLDHPLDVWTSPSGGGWVVQWPARRV
jgi:hypothetical protein